MNRFGLHKGDEAYVSVRINKVLHLDIIIAATTDTTVEAEVHGAADADLISSGEALKAASGAVDFLLERPRLKKLLAERIAELREEIAEEGANAPSPADGLEDIPF